MLPVRAHFSVFGLYSSALPPEQQPLLQQVAPPATSTCPFGSKVAFAVGRATFILPVGLNVPVAGLKSSALLVTAPPTSPPVTSAWPFGSAVAVNSVRAAPISPVAVNL